jgi:hypothetical protein
VEILIIYFNLFTLAVPNFIKKIIRATDKYTSYFILTQNTHVSQDVTNIQTVNSVRSWCEMEFASIGKEQNADDANITRLPAKAHWKLTAALYANFKTFWQA